MQKYSTKIILLIILIPICVLSQNKDFQLRHGKGWINSIHFMPDGKMFASASLDGTVFLWNAITGKRIWRFDLDLESKTKNSYTVSHILDMKVSPDGNIIAVSYFQSSVVGETAQGDDVYRIALIDAKNGRVVKTLNGHTSLIGGIEFSPDGKSLLSASGDQTARLWDIETGQEKLQIKLKAQGGLPLFSRRQTIRYRYRSDLGNAAAVYCRNIRFSDRKSVA